MGTTPKLASVMVNGSALTRARYLQSGGKICSRGRHVIIVEDIVDTGRTLTRLREQAKENGAASVAAVALLNKACRRVVDVDVEYLGFECPDEFVVGCVILTAVVLFSLLDSRSCKSLMRVMFHHASP
jgi:hypoxanthine phosphoribosyltransferase